MSYSVGGGYGGNRGYSTGYSSQSGYSSSYNPSSSGGYSAGIAYGNGLKGHYNMHMDSASASVIAEVFLESERPWTPLVSNLGDVQEVVGKTFELMTGQVFPQDSIKIVIAKPEDFKQMHNSVSNNWSSGVVGFSLNRYGKGVSEIFIKQDHLDSVLLTIGHEIGHVLSPSLPNAQDEEAKAHAFSIAWMETIRENDVSGLKPNIRLNPARNGLHDVALDFVNYLMQTGSSAFDVFKTLAFGLTSIIAMS